MPIGFERSFVGLIGTLDLTSVRIVSPKPVTR